jgi:NAD(P)-dependent dehydrogenase (short-subunit alcohol dehydrogenase family)
MDNFLEGKNTIITGGTRGIGKAIAASMLSAGANVVICGQSSESVDQAVVDLAGYGKERISGIAADVRDEDSVAALFAFAETRSGGLDILINNAGIGIFKPAGELSVEEWRRVIDTNLTGTFLCCKQALPRFGNRGGGFIVNISSLAGKNPFPTGAAYNASKFGLNGFSEAVMMDHRYDKVRVSYIMPGSVDTEFRPANPGQEQGWKIAAEDVADIVLFVLRMPPRTLVSRVEVRPSAPKKG